MRVYYKILSLFFYYIYYNHYIKKNKYKLKFFIRENSVIVFNLFVRHDMINVELK